MIIENGTLQTKLIIGGGLDDNGNPVRPVEAWGVPIPCNIKTNQYSNQGKVNGNTFTIASYEVLIEMQPFTAESVKLVREGQELGEFPVQSAEPLTEVGIIKILV